MSKFEEGKTYEGRSPCDYDCIISVTVAKRTAKTIVTSEGERFRINTSYDGEEIIHPWGKYSMSPIVGASKAV